MGERQTRFNKQGQAETIHQGPDVDSGAVSDDLATAKKSTTAGAGLGKIAPPKTTPMPKQADYPDHSSWVKAVREWRGTPETNPQKAAIVKKLREQ